MNKKTILTVFIIFIMTFSIGCGNENNKEETLKEETRIEENSGNISENNTVVNTVSNLTNSQFAIDGKIFTLGESTFADIEKKWTLSIPNIQVEAHSIETVTINHIKDNNITMISLDLANTTDEKIGRSQCLIVGASSSGNKLQPQRFEVSNGLHMGDSLSQVLAALEKNTVLSEEKEDIIKEYEERNSTSIYCSTTDNKYYYSVSVSDSGLERIGFYIMNVSLLAKDPEGYKNAQNQEEISDSEDETESDTKEEKPLINYNLAINQMALDGTIITLGESTVKDLPEGWYCEYLEKLMFYKNSNYHSDYFKIEEPINQIVDGEHCAEIYMTHKGYEYDKPLIFLIYNTSTEAKPMEECTIVGYNTTHLVLWNKIPDIQFYGELRYTTPGKNIFPLFGDGDGEYLEAKNTIETSDEYYSYYIDYYVTDENNKQYYYKFYITSGGIIHYQFDDCSKNYRDIYRSKVCDYYDVTE